MEFVGGMPISSDGKVHGWLPGTRQFDEVRGWVPCLFKRVTKLMVEFFLMFYLSEWRRWGLSACYSHGEEWMAECLVSNLSEWQSQRLIALLFVWVTMIMADCIEIHQSPMADVRLSMKTMAECTEVHRSDEAYGWIIWCLSEDEVDGMSAWIKIDVECWMVDECLVMLPSDNGQW